MTTMVLIQFAIFVSMLGFIIAFHHHSLAVSAVGTVALVAFTLYAATLGAVPAFSLAEHLGHHGHLLFNIFALLLGFTLMAELFETSGFIPLLQRYLPSDWKGPFVLILVVFFLSIFLDNIAGAIIGAIIAKTIFDGKVHTGYLVGIVAASNAGGAGSVIGDTTTTILWLSGVHPLIALKALFPALVTVSIFGYHLSKLQHEHQAMIPHKPDDSHTGMDYKKLSIVALCIVCIFVGNFFFDLPGLGLWIALGIGSIAVSVAWNLMKVSWKDAAFLCLLITAATILPTSFMPEPSALSTTAIGFISALFDNIPLTVLAVQQDNHDWGMLAFALGFGGSMMWFGSSAGVALCSLFPQGKNAINWIKDGASIFVAYLVGCLAYYLVFGYNPIPISQAGTW